MYSTVHVHVQCTYGINVLCNWYTVQYMYMYNVLMELVYCVIDVHTVHVHVQCTNGLVYCVIDVQYMWISVLCY